MENDYLVSKMRERTTEELVSIYTENNQEMWTDEAFKAIRMILNERGVEAPLQRTPPKEDKDPKYSVIMRNIIAIIVFGIISLFMLYKIPTNITWISMQIFALIILTADLIYCFKRIRWSVIWMILMLPPIFIWVAHRIFPYTSSQRGHVTNLQAFLVEAFGFTFSKAHDWVAIINFTLCWVTVIILEAIIFKLLMWSRKSNKEEKLSESYAEKSSEEWKHIDLRSEEQKEIEEKAYRESKLDLGDENEELVPELMSLLSKVRKGFEENPNFEDEGYQDIRNKIHKIGQHLYKKGGRELMLKFHGRVFDLGENARLVEQIWWEGPNPIR